MERSLSGPPDGLLSLWLRLQEALPTPKERGELGGGDGARPPPTPPGRGTAQGGSVHVTHQAILATRGQPWATGRGIQSTETTDGPVQLWRWAGLFLPVDSSPDSLTWWKLGACDVSRAVFTPCVWCVQGRIHTLSNHSLSRSMRGTAVRTEKTVWEGTWCSRVQFLVGGLHLRTVGWKSTFLCWRKGVCYKYISLRVLSFLLPSELEVEGRQDWDNLWSLVDTNHDKNTSTGEDLFFIVGRNKCL